MTSRAENGKRKSGDEALRYKVWGLRRLPATSMHRWRHLTSRDLRVAARLAPSEPCGYRPRIHRNWVAVKHHRRPPKSPAPFKGPPGPLGPICCSQGPGPQDPLEGRRRCGEHGGRIAMFGCRVENLCTIGGKAVLPDVREEPRGGAIRPFSIGSSHCLTQYVPV